MRLIYIFDLGGVLINLNVNRCLQAFERIMGEENMRLVLGMDSRGEGVKAVSIASKQLMADFERGLISSDSFVSQVQQYSYSGTTTEEIVEAWMSMLDELPEERLAFVDSLRAKGHPVYLLSNGNDLHYDFINRKYGLESHFDGFFLSQKMHMAKPESEIFEAVQKELGNPENVIFIDDLQANRLAAEQTVHWQTYESIDALRLRHSLT